MNSITHLQKIAEAASANGDAFKSIYDVTLKASEQLFTLNNDFFRSLLEGSTTAKTSLEPHELFNAYAKQLERVSEYFREASDIGSQTQVEVFKVGTQSAEEVTRVFFAQMEALFKSFPADQAHFSDALKSVVNSVTTTRKAA